VSTSGTVTYSVNEADIIKDALIEIGYLDAEETPTANDIVIARRKLNLLIKQWTSQIDFAPGLKMWTRRTGYLFLQDGQVQYSLGPSGDNATETYTRTTLSASAANGAGTVTVASVTGIATTYYIGVVLDSGSIHWTTVNGAPAGSVVTLTAVLTGAASSGNTVFCYQTKMRRPFELLSGSRRDTDGLDAPVDVQMNLAEYEAIYDKTSEGSPYRLYFEAQRTNAVVYLNCAPEDVTEVIRLPYLSYIEDFAAETDDADFPAEWARPLVLQLANDCCRPFGRAVSADLKQDLMEALAMARKAYPQVVVLSYESDPDSY
jgi:hypothetical protein